MSENVKLIFQTEQDTVHAMLNLDIGVNLASIGNKLYLLHCGQLVDTGEAGTTTTTTTTVDSEEEVIPKVTMAFPTNTITPIVISWVNASMPPENHASLR